MNTTLGIETPRQTPWPGLHWAPISEVKCPWSLRQVSRGPSDFVNFVLQVAEQGIQAFGGTPELLQHEAFFLIHIFKHRFQEAADKAFGFLQHLKGKAQASLARHQGLCSRRTHLACEVPVNLLMSKGRGGCLLHSQAHVPSNATVGSRCAMMLSPQSLDGWVGPTSSPTSRALSFNQGKHNWILLSMVSRKSLENSTSIFFCFIFLICETGVMIPNSRMVGITE